MFQSFLDDFKGRAVDPAERGEVARSLTEKCGYAAAALTILPIPGSEIIGVMPVHVGMVVGIGHIYNVEISRDSATELILRIGTTVGLSLIGSRFAMTMGKFILPGLGGLISAPFMYASTLAIGAVARTYFERSGDIGQDEMKSLYNDMLKSAKKDFKPDKMRSSEAKKMAEAAAAEKASSAGNVSVKEGPAAETDEDPVARLERLRELLNKGLIEEEEYEKVKARILSDL